ncbi:MAG: uracil-xanthine permease [Clostridiaceae bacterium]|nr:uracil-xanthine permease [Clostridiaceae bacterium]
MGLEPIYDVKELGLGKTLVLGLQHMFAMFGATVLVPLLTGLNVSTALFFAGVGTLLFHLLSKGRVPAFLGSSFAFIAGYATVSGGDPARLPYAVGGVFVAGLLYVVVGILFKFLGPKRIMRFFPPVVTGPVIVLIGLILAPSALGNIQSPITGRGGAELALGVNWLIALAVIATVIICNIWGKGMIKIIPILISLLVGYGLSLAFGIVDFSGLQGVGVFHLPLASERFMKFEASAIITIVPIALATIMEHIGDIMAIGATTRRNYILDPGLHMTLLGDGLATSLSSAFGGPANTTYGENTGVLVLTRVFDPVVMRIAALFAIVASFFPAIEAVISSIPGVVIGGISFILYGMISAIGVRTLVENQVDLTKTRNLVVAALILVSGLGFDAIGGLTIPIGDTQLVFSGLAIAAIVGIVLNAILPGKDYEFKIYDEDGNEQPVE